MEAETRALDREILKFILKYSDKTSAPDSEFERLAFKIFEYQFERNGFYRRLCESEGKRPDRLAGWKEIPAMPAVGFKELVLTTFPRKKVARVFQTSGTTQDLKGAHFFDTLKLYQAAVLPVFKKYLLPDNAKCRFFFLTASPKDLPHSSLSHMMGVVNAGFSYPKKGKFYVKNGFILFDELVRDLRSNQKRKIIILATAFSLRAFLDFLKMKKTPLKLAVGSRLMETGGFKGKGREISKPRLYVECEKWIGISKDHCVSEYGMTELSSQFYDTTLRDKISKLKRKPFKEGPAWLKTLVIDPRTGKEIKKGKAGVLRHFDLANRGSVIAIQTEDLGRAVGGGFELLGRAPQATLRGCSLIYEDLVLSGAER